MKLSLSPRQRQIANLIADGNRPQDVAKQLRMSPQAVRRQVSAILLKLELDSSLGISAWVWRRRIKKKNVTIVTNQQLSS